MRFYCVPGSDQKEKERERKKKRKRKRESGALVADNEIRESLVSRAHFLHGPSTGVQRTAAGEGKRETKKKNEKTRERTRRKSASVRAGVAFARGLGRPGKRENRGGGR